MSKRINYKSYKPKQYQSQSTSTELCDQKDLQSAFKDLTRFFASTRTNYVVKKILTNKIHQISVYDVCMLSEFLDEILRAMNKMSSNVYPAERQIFFLRRTILERAITQVGTMAIILDRSFSS